MTVSKLIRPIGLSLCSLLMVACGDGAEDTDKDQQAVCDELPPLAEKDTYKVGFAQLYEEKGPWRDANTASMLDEAEKRGYEMVYDRGTSPDPAEQVARMDALIEAKVDAIFIAPHDETVLAPSVVKARRACIPTFLVDRAVDERVAKPGKDYVSYLASDFRQEGVLAAEWLIANTEGEANIIELEGTVGSSPAILRKEGFDETIADHDDMSILVSESADFNEDQAYDATKRLVEEHPTVNVIYSHNDGMSFGVVTALEEMGFVPGVDIKVISIDGTQKAIEYILHEDGPKINVVVECNPKFGPIAFDTMEAYAKGEDVPLRVNNVDRVFDKDSAEAYLPEAY
jgi:galactofuranose transport system substrate-binding protein